MGFNPEKSSDAGSASSLENTAEQEGQKEVQEEHVEDQESKDVEESPLEKLQQALDGARAGYARVQYKRESLVEKIKQSFGKDVNTGSDQDVDTMKTTYQQSLADFRRAKMAEIDQLPEDQQKDALAELKAFDLTESCNLYDSHVAAKMDTLGGKAGEVLQKTVDWYKKIPTKYKLAISATLFVGGVATAGGAAAGIFGAAALGKRVLGAAAAGVGATGWMEVRAQKKEQMQTNASLENFKNLSLEEQRAHLAQFDDEQIDAAFQGKVTGRQRRVAIGMTTAAGMMALGSLGKIFGATEASAGEIPPAESAAMEHVTPQTEHVPKGNTALIKKAIEQMRAQQQMAQEAASHMNVDQSNITAHFEGGVPVEINGQSVSEGLAAEQPTAVSSVGVENMQQAMEQQPSHNDVATRLNSMKNMSSIHETPEHVAQPDVAHVEQPQTPKKGLMDTFNKMRAHTTFEESHPLSSGVTHGVETQSQNGGSVTYHEAPQHAALAEHAPVTKPVETHVAHQVRETAHTATVEKGVPPRVMSFAEEQRYIKDLVLNDPSFNQTVAGRIKDFYGLPAKNIAGTRMSELAKTLPAMQQRVDRVLAMAGKYLGHDVVKAIVNENPVDGQTATIGTIFTRISALGQRAGVAEKIFSV